MVVLLRNREGEVFAFFLESPNQVYATMLRPEFRSMPTTKSFKNYTKNKKSGKKIKTVCYNLQLLVWKMESGKLRHYKFNCKVKGKKRIRHIPRIKSILLLSNLENSSD